MIRPLFHQAIPVLAGLTVFAGIATAQEIGAPTGYLSFGAAYSERYGETIFASLVEEDFLNTGVGVDAAAEYSRSGYRISTNLDTDIALSIPGLAVDPFMDVLIYLDDHSWQESAYDSKRVGFDADLIFPVRQGVYLSAGYFYYDNSISNVNANTSPLVTAEQQVTSGAKLGLHYETLDTPVRPSNGVSLGLTAQYAGIGGDTNWNSLTAHGSVYQPLPLNGVGSISFVAGQIRTLNDEPISISERAFLGYDLPRGFAFGGIGPRDNDGGSVDTALGGETYVAASVESDFPMVETNSGAVYGGVFWDGGSVWDLHGTPVGASGAIDDSMYWRASYGVSVTWISDFGQVQLSWAEPYLSQPDDITQPLSVSFSTAF